MRHGRDVSALDVQHLVLNPPDVTDTEADRSFRAHMAADLLFLRVLLVIIGRLSTAH